MQHLGDLSFLASHPLTRTLGCSTRPNDRDGLGSLLTQVVESLRPSSQGLRANRLQLRYQAIYERYIVGRQVDEVCENLSVSQREFYRLLREGLEAVVHVLMEPVVDGRIDDGAEDQQPPATFFGREKELNRLEDALLESKQGRGRTIVIHGVPGVGKTRLMDEFGAMVRQRGELYLKGHMFEDSTEPYDSWIEALAPSLDLLTQTEQDALAAQNPLLFSLLANRELPGASGEPDSIDVLREADSRQVFYEGVVRFLELVSRKAAIVLAFDDLQWAPELSLFSYVVRRAAGMRLLILGTMRDEQSLERPLVYDQVQDLVRGRLLSVVNLPPLSRPEIASLVRSKLGAEVDDRLIDTVFDRTTGNPFFAEELVRSMWERGDVTLRNDAWTVAEHSELVIPPTIAALIEDRIQRLPARVRHGMQVASVLGERFHEGLLTLMFDEPDEELSSVLEDAQSLGLLIEEFVFGEEAYRFVDPLMRATLYNSIPVSVRRNHHLRARDAIERFYDGDLERHTQELARHYHLAGQLAEGAAHAFRSGEKAESLFAWATAIKWYEMALSLWEQADGPLKHQAQVCLKLGRLYCQSSLDAARGVSLLRRALATFQELGELQTSARAHLEIARVHMAGFDVHQIDLEEALSHLDAARQTLEKVASPSGLAQVYLGLFTAYSRLGEFGQGNGWMEKANAVSLELDDPSVAAESVISAASYLLISQGEAVRGHEMFEEAWEIASSECLPSAADHCRQVASLIFGVSLKDPRRGLSWIRRQPDYGTRWLSLQSQTIALHTLAGDFQQAGEAFEELTVRLAEAGRPSFGVYPADAGLFLARSGRWDEALPLLTEGLRWTKDHRYHLGGVRAASVRGALLLEMGEVEKAEADLRWAYDTAVQHQSVLNILKTAPPLCEVYIEQRRLTAAAQLLEEHGELAERVAEHGGVAADVWLAAGMYYAATGESVRADDKFRAAADLSARFSLPWDQARAFYLWGLSLADGRRNEMLTWAAAIWESIGATRYAALAISRAAS